MSRVLLRLSPGFRGHAFRCTEDADQVRQVAEPGFVGDPRRRTPRVPEKVLRLLDPDESVGLEGGHAKGLPEVPLELAPADPEGGPKLRMSILAKTYRYNDKGLQK